MSSPGGTSWLGRFAAGGGLSKPAPPPPPPMHQQDEQQHAGAAPHSAASSREQPGGGGHPGGHQPPTPETQKRVDAAKTYIENLYRNQAKSLQQRMDRRTVVENEALPKEARAELIHELEQQERKFTRLKRAKISVEDFEPLTIIGRGAFGEVRLEDLPTPLRVTATDAANGRMVVLRCGRLVDAIRASIAMPFMFAPRTIEGRRLVDGFVSDPLPVSAAVDARTVLAMGFDAPMPQRVNSPSRLLAQVTSAMTNNLMHARLAAAELDGMRLLRVFPQLNRRIGLFETGAMPYLVEEGRLAAEQQLPALVAMLQRQPHLQVA